MEKRFIAWQLFSDEGGDGGSKRGIITKAVKFEIITEFLAAQKACC